MKINKFFLVSIKIVENIQNNFYKSRLLFFILVSCELSLIYIINVFWDYGLAPCVPQVDVYMFKSWLRPLFFFLYGVQL